MMKKVMLKMSILSIASLPIVLTVSCSHAQKHDGLMAKNNGVSTDYILDKEEYNKLYHKIDDNHIGVAVIAHHKIYEDIVAIAKGESIEKALDESHFIFKRNSTSIYGAFLLSFADTRLDPNNFMHGTRVEKNYGDFYPLFYVNGAFSQMGASGFKLEGHEMIEISYDDK